MLEHIDFHEIINRFAARDCSVAEMDQLFDALLSDHALLALADAMGDILFVPRVAFTPDLLSEKYRELERRRTERLLCSGVTGKGDSGPALFLKNCPESQL